MNVLALIPARGGSKSIPSKNIAPCAGKPLIEWTTDAAKQCKRINAINVSTDSQEIADVVKHTCRVGVISRPPDLAADDTPMEPVVLHALSCLDGVTFDVLVLLQPTSPLRTAADIDGALALLESSGANSVVSVYESYAVPFTGEEPARRQERKPTLMLNGAIYAVRVPWFLEHGRLIDKDTVPFVMPESRSIDVDYSYQMAMAGALIGKL